MLIFHQTPTPNPISWLLGGDVGSSESHRYSEGFGAGLLVKLTLPLTRWMPGVARTMSL